MNSSSSLKLCSKTVTSSSRELRACHLSLIASLISSVNVLTAGDFFVGFDNFRFLGSKLSGASSDT